MENYTEFKKVVELWQADKQQYVKKSTFAAYSLLITNHLLPAFAGNGDIHEEDVQQFVFAKLDEGLSQKSVKDILIVLKMVLRFGVKYNLIAHRQIDIRFPTERERQEVEVLSKANQRKIMEFVKSNFTFQNLGIYICLSAGLRIGEVCALTWDDIDFRKNVIHVNKSIVFEKNNKPHLSVPKTDKSIRDVDAPRIVMEALRRYRCTTIVPKLFSGRYGDYKGMTGYIRDWERIKKKIEAALGHETDLTLYCFRHNYITMLYYSNVSLKEAQRLVGHTSYKMIMEVYAHLDAQKEDTAAKLNAIDF
jgi:integrase